MAFNINSGNKSEGVADDIRQSIVIARNEIKKFFSGKKILIFSGLMGLILVLLAALPYIAGGNYESASEITLMFASFISFIIMLAGVLFTATSIVSEYEERTALILFTRPIKKWSIFLGKIIASLIVVIAYAAIYYIFTAAYSLAVTGSVEGNLLVSFGLCVCGIVGITGLSILLSSMAKKGSTASILTLVVLLLLLGIVSSILGMDSININTDWMLNKALGSISTSIGDLDPNGHFVPTQIDIGYNAAVMLAWGVVCSIIGFFLFKKRDF